MHPVCCGSQQSKALVSCVDMSTRLGTSIGFASCATQSGAGHTRRTSSTVDLDQRTFSARPTEPQGVNPGANSMLIRAVRAFIWCYQIFLRPLLGPRCRFEPSCSNYAMEAFQEHGLWTGGCLTCRRLCRCHPWGGSGWDPVPPPSTSPSSNQ
jgi:putative membrane protein insertion efficiency factor